MTYIYFKPEFMQSKFKKHQQSLFPKRKKKKNSATKNKQINQAHPLTRIGKRCTKSQNKRSPITNF